MKYEPNKLFTSFYFSIRPEINYSNRFPIQSNAEHHTNQSYSIQDAPSCPKLPPRGARPLQQPTERRQHVQRRHQCRHRARRRSSLWRYINAHKDVMKLQIRVDDDGNIVDCKFKTFGCGSAIASSSLVTEKIKGMNVRDAIAVSNSEIAKELCLPPVKLHCSSKFICFKPKANSIIQALFGLPNYYLMKWHFKQYY